MLFDRACDRTRFYSLLKKICCKMKPLSTCFLNAWGSKEDLKSSVGVLAETFPCKILPAKTSPGGIFWREMIPQEAGRKCELKTNSTCSHAFDERTAKRHVNSHKVLFSNFQSCQCARCLTVITSKGFKTPFSKGQLF